MTTSRFEPQRLDPTRMPATIRTKWPDELLGEGFVPLPKRFLRALSSVFPDSPEIAELSILLAAVDYRRRNVSRQPSIEYLAFIAGLDVHDANGALQRLRQKGYATLRTSLDDQGVEVDLKGLYAAVKEALP